MGHPHTIPLPRRTLLRPGIAPVPKAEINPTKAGRPRARRRGSSYIGWPSRSAGTRRRARGLAPASQATANVPGRLALRSHNDAAGSTRDGVTTTSQRQAGRVMKCTASLHGSSCAVCNNPGVGENGPELDLETRTAMRPHETAVQHPSAGRESSRRLYYYAAGSPP
jgi:hypothetical protein